MAKAGTDYERFVLTIQQAILNSEEFSKQKNIKIELNKKIVDNTGTEREFDLYWEYQLAGITYKTIIECKDYNSRISVEKIDALIGKIKDLPDIKPVFATKTGYQSGAETKAKHNKIDLLIVREQIEDDWKDKNGNPFIKKIFIRLIALPAPEIINFQTFVDEDWIIKNTNIDTTKPITMQGMNNEIFIYDENKNIIFNIDEKNTNFDADTSVHSHFLCRRCGQIYDLKCPESVKTVENQEMDGHQVTEVHYYYKGICKNCLRKDKETRID